MQSNKENSPVVELANVDMNFYKRSGLFKKSELNVLDRINLKIHRGEIVVVVGESGSGKTTTANVIAGLLKPTRGQVFYYEKDIWNMNKMEYDEYRNGIQIVQQDSYAALNPMRTIFRTLADPLLIKRVVNKNNVVEHVINLLENVGLTPVEHFIDKYPHQLSGGQRQRVLIARAISMNPRVILADEPVSMIDVSLRISILNLLARLNKEQEISILYITHDLATARYVGQKGRIAVMYLGQIVETGNVQEVLQNPQHPYLQALLTAVPIPSPRLSRIKKEPAIFDAEPPSIINKPSGCRFHTRCVFCEDICKQEQPHLRQIESSMVSCHKAGELPKFEIFEKDITG